MLDSSNLEILQIRIDGKNRDIYLRRNSSDPALVGQVFVDDAFTLKNLPRLHELKEWLTECRKSGNRPLILDGGANIGLSSIVFAAEIPDALIVAVEPEPENFEMLLLNTKGLSVMPLPAALGGDVGQVAIGNPGRGEWGYQTCNVNSDIKEIVVPKIKIDDIIKPLSDKFKPFIIKIDIEGAEDDVFSAGGDWLYHAPLIIVEIHDWMLPRARSSHPVLRKLLDADRDFVISGENLFCMLNSVNFDIFNMQNKIK